MCLMRQSHCGNGQEVTYIEITEYVQRDSLGVGGEKLHFQLPVSPQADRPTQLPEVPRFHLPSVHWPFGKGVDAVAGGGALESVQRSYITINNISQKQQQIQDLQAHAAARTHRRR